MRRLQIKHVTTHGMYRSTPGPALSTANGRDAPPLHGNGCGWQFACKLAHRYIEIALQLSLQRGGCASSWKNAAAVGAMLGTSLNHSVKRRDLGLQHQEVKHALTTDQPQCQMGVAIDGHPQGNTAYGREVHLRNQVSGAEESLG